MTKKEFIEEIRKMLNSSSSCNNYKLVELSCWDWIEKKLKIKKIPALKIPGGGIPMDINIDKTEWMAVHEVTINMSYLVTGSGCTEFKKKIIIPVKSKITARNVMSDNVKSFYLVRKKDASTAIFLKEKKISLDTPNENTHTRPARPAIEDFEKFFITAESKIIERVYGMTGKVTITTTDGRSISGIRFDLQICGKRNREQKDAPNLETETTVKIPSDFYNLIYKDKGPVYEYAVVYYYAMDDNEKSVKGYQKIELFDSTKRYSRSAFVFITDVEGLENSTVKKVKSEDLYLEQKESNLDTNKKEE